MIAINGSGLFTEAVVGRFWGHVDKRGHDECWPWKMHCNPGGYGRFSTVRGKMFLAHRVAYALAIGEIPDGLVIDHLCRNRRCCNPSHMEPVTRVENTMRGEAPWARKKRQTMCVNGHPLAGDNLIVRRHGHRGCRECRRRSVRESCRKRYAIRRAGGLCVHCQSHALEGHALCESCTTTTRERSKAHYWRQRVALGIGNQPLALTAGTRDWHEDVA